MRHRAPEEYAVWHSLHVVEYRSSRGCKTRHCLKEGIYQMRDISSNKVWQHSECTEYDPCGSNHDIGVASAQAVVGTASGITEQQSSRNGNKCRHKKGEHVVFTVEKRRSETCHHHQSLDDQQLPDYFRQYSIVHHSVFGLKNLSTFLRLCS